MSASSPSLKNPFVIGALIIGAVVVTILNIQTFGPPKKSGPRVQMAAMDQPALPPDLAILVREAMAEKALVDGDHSTVSPRQKHKAGRDPFHSKATPVVVKARPKPVQAKATKLACTAIMTGGIKPSACINGKFYSPGDKVGRYTVAWIASNGVTLKNSKGVKKFVPMSINSQKRGAFQLTVAPNKQPSNSNQ